MTLPLASTPLAHVCRRNTRNGWTRRPADYPNQRPDVQHGDGAAQHAPGNRPALYLRSHGRRPRPRVGGEQRCRRQSRRAPRWIRRSMRRPPRRLHPNPRRCWRGRRQRQLSGANDWRSRRAHLRRLLPAPGDYRRRVQRRRRGRPRQRRRNDDAAISEPGRHGHDAVRPECASPRRRSRIPLAAAPRLETTGGAATSI